MSPAEIVKTAQKQGVTLQAVGDKLRCRYQDRPIPEIRALLKANKPALLAYLTKRPAQNDASGRKDQAEESPSDPYESEERTAIQELERQEEQEAKRRQGARTDIQEKIPESEKGQARDHAALPLLEAEAKRRQGAKSGFAHVREKIPEHEKGRARDHAARSQNTQKVADAEKCHVDVTDPHGKVSRRRDTLPQLDRLSYIEQYASPEQMDLLGSLSIVELFERLVRIEAFFNKWPRYAEAICYRVKELHYTKEEVLAYVSKYQPQITMFHIDFALHNKGKIHPALSAESPLLPKSQQKGSLQSLNCAGCGEHTRASLEEQ